jgi:hypothetical protein
VREGENSTTRGMRRRHWTKLLPYVATGIIFIVIFCRIPVAGVADALEHAPALAFIGVFLPYSAIYWLVDSACLTWVISRFNQPLRFREILPIRASMYLLSLINTNLGQGGITWYVHRKLQRPFLEILSSILLIALMEVYQLLLFSTGAVVFFHPTSAEQAALIRGLRIVYALAWCLLVGMIAVFAQARRTVRIRHWIESSLVGSIARSFVAARPLDYAIILAIKAPSFGLALAAQHVALGLYGISIPLIKLVLFLPLVFLAAALPIAVAHLGTSQAAWLLFFSGSAPETKILAYSLAAHFSFMFCNGLLGLLFLPYAARELTTLHVATSDENRLQRPLVDKLWAQPSHDVRMENRPFRFPQHQLQTLRRARFIYLTTIRTDGSQSKPARLWFTVTSEHTILIQTGPDTWHARRIRRGSPVIVSVGSRDGPAFIGSAEFSQDPRVIEQIVRDFPRKYLTAWLGWHRPTRSSFIQGSRVAIRITPVQLLPPDFVPQAGAAPPLITAHMASAGRLP